jgi:hypothetical protein
MNITKSGWSIKGTALLVGCLALCWS